MLKIVVALLLLMVSTSSVYSAQKLTLFECDEIKKLADIDTTTQQISIANKRISRKDIELKRARGLVISKIAFEAADVDMPVKDYAQSRYEQKCKNSSYIANTELLKNTKAN